MPTNYDAIDLQFSWNGDYLIGSDGDLLDTSKDQIQSLIQEIQTISNSDLKDWREFPEYAGALNDFVGEPNNRQTASKMVERLRGALINNNIVRADDVSIRVVPVTRYEILLIVAVAAAPTANNTITDGTPAKTALVYNYLEQGVFFVEANQFFKSRDLGL